MKSTNCFSSSGRESRGDKEGGRDKDKGKRSFLFSGVFFFFLKKNKTSKQKEETKAYLGIENPRGCIDGPPFWYIGISYVGKNVHTKVK